MLLRNCTWTAIQVLLLLFLVDMYKNILRKLGKWFFDEDPFLSKKSQTLQRAGMCKIELMIKERTNRFIRLKKNFSDKKRRKKSLDQRLLVLACQTCLR